MSRSFLSLATALLLLSSRPALAEVQPNLVFILTDDQRWNALGLMGSLEVQTPNLDRLARKGVLFANHFVTTSICCVSRASILSGQYARRHGIGDFVTPFTEKQWRESYPAQLRQHGYRTGFIGKFGVGQPAQVMAMAGEFDYWRGIPGQGGDYFISPDDPTQTHATARMGDEALTFLREQGDKQPFCLSISFIAPHARDHMPREFTPDLRDETLYQAATVVPPPNATETLFQQLPSFVKTSEARARWHWRFDTPDKFQRNTKDYYRLITGIDREVGRLLAELEARGLADNTIIIFTSDNGFFLGDRGLSDKWFMYEESIRVPLIIYDPRQPATVRGRVEEAMTLNLDFAPTLLAMAGVKPPVAMQGRDLTPLIQGETPADWRTEFFYEHHFSPDLIPPSEGVRTTRWSYFRWVGSEPRVEELYDLQLDPLQTRNLIHEPVHTAVLAELRARWAAYRDQLP